MNLEAVFEELGNAMGIDRLAFDADGQCALLFDGEHEVTFAYDRKDRALFMYCEIGKLSGRGNEVCPRLMEASLLGAETGGAAFSVDRRLDAVVLWKRHDENFDHLSLLEQAINAFLAQAIRWKAQLAQNVSSEQNGESLPDAQIMNNLSSFV